MFVVFLLSGLFLGWSLGANDAANLYGTAVGTRMIRFRTAAITASIFILIGAVFGGAGASHTLGKLGAVNALPGAFTVALAAALTVTWMTKLKLPVSTSQAVVGAIIGWNLFSGSLTDLNSLTKIVTSWVLCPILAAVFAIILLKLAQLTMSVVKLHLFRIDGYTRYGLFFVGAFASYSLGANNIANVMGVFVPSSPFSDLDILGVLTLDGAQQLFFLGAIAIGVGVFTYSRRVMATVGNDLFKLSPVAALIVVMAQAMVLFLFSSVGLENWLATHGLPTVPLVPVSSSQAVIGAVVGIGLVKGGRNIQFRVLARISSGWVSTPLIAGAVSFVALFFVQNVFAQPAYAPVTYKVSHELVLKLRSGSAYDPTIEQLLGEEYPSAVKFTNATRELKLNASSTADVVRLARLRPMRVDIERLRRYYDHSWFSEEQLHAVFRLHDQQFDYDWQLADALAALSPEWRLLPASKRHKLHNAEVREKLQFLQTTFAGPAAAP